MGFVSWFWATYVIHFSLYLPILGGLGIFQGQQGQVLYESLNIVKSINNSLSPKTGSDIIPPKKSLRSLIFANFMCTKTFLLILRAKSILFISKKCMREKCNALSVTCNFLKCSILILQTSLRSPDKTVCYHGDYCFRFNYFLTACTINVQSHSQIFVN